MSASVCPTSKTKSRFKLHDEGLAQTQGKASDAGNVLGLPLKGDSQSARGWSTPRLPLRSGLPPSNGGPSHPCIPPLTDP
jgi:hypothetical protein